MVEVAALGVRAYGDGLEQTAGGLKKLADAATDAEKATQQFSYKSFEGSKAAKALAPEAGKAADKIEEVGKESKTTAGALEQMASKANGTTGAMNSMADMLGGVVGKLTAIAVTGLSIHALVRYADAWSDMQSKVGAAIKDMDAAPAMMQRMVKIANASYSSLDQTVEVYSQNVSVLKDLGLNADKAADYTESLNHMLVITATKGQQAASVQGALSRAMAVGKLNGLGLQTVLANGGRVAEALAKELKTTVNGLQEMGRQGKITSEVIANALLNSLAAVRKEAEAMPATIADGFQRINTGIQAIVGMFDKAVGASGAFAGALVVIGDSLAQVAIWIHENGTTVKYVFDQLIGVAIAAAGAAAIWFGGVMLASVVAPVFAAAGALIAVAAEFGLAAVAAWLMNGAIAGSVIALKALTLAIAATGIGALIIGVGLLVAKFLEVASATGSAAEAWKLFSELGSEALDRIGWYWLGMQARADTAMANLEASFWSIMAAIVEGAGTAMDRFVAFHVGAAAAVGAAFEGLPAAFGNVGARAINALIEKISAGIDKVVGWINVLYEAVGATPIKGPDLSNWKLAVPEAANIGTAVGDAFNGAMEKTYVDGSKWTKGMRETISSLEESARVSTTIANASDILATAPLKSWEKMTEVIDAANEKLKKTKTTLDDFGGGTGNGTGTGTGTKGGGGGGAADKAAEYIKKLEQEYATLNATLGMTNEQLSIYNALQAMGDTATAAQRDRVIELVPQLDALRERVQAIKSATEEMKGALSNAFSSLVTGAAKGKEALAGLLKKLAEMLANSAFKMLWEGGKGGSGGLGGLVSKFVSAIGFADGGVFVGGMPTPVQAFAAGGVVSSPTTFPMRNGGTGLMGEAGPEAIMPLSRGPDGKLGVKSASGGGNNTTVNVNMNIDATGADAGAVARMQAALQKAQVELKDTIIQTVNLAGKRRQIQ